VPVLLLGDEGVGHLRERVVIPPETPIYRRATDAGAPPFGEALVPPMPAFGDGAKLMVTGSTHDAWGYRRTDSSEAQAELVRRLCAKITENRHLIIRTEALLCEEDSLDALIVAYGSTARSAYRAALDLRREGLTVGLLRLATLWPFADEALRRLARRARRVVVPEMNRGQMLREVQRIAPDALGYHRVDGEVIVPGEIAEAIREALR
jgi:2-oxoglutarate ferredoxin oxidoreductase subunit alpha